MHYKIRNTLIDLSENSLKINNQLVDCSEKIHQALFLFLESKNKTVTKESLITSLWGDLIVSDDSLFKVIQSLRRIFKENGLDGVLENIYGKGYKLKETIEKNIQAPTAEFSSNPSLSLFKRYKTLLIIVSSFMVLITTVHLFTTEKISTLINTKVYLDYKSQIKANPKVFLSLIDEKFKHEDLDTKSKVNIYSLKAYAHFSLGHYEELFDYGQKAIDLAGDNKSLALADILLHFAKVFYYRADGEKSSFYIKKANKMYSELKNLDGVYACQYIILSLRYLAKEYDQEFKGAKTVYANAVKDKHGKGQIIALLHMYFASSELNQINGAQDYVLRALEVAVELNDRDVISTCYGVLAQDNLEKGQYIKAMKWTNKLLKYAVSQPNTNLFMQGFSYMYNILSPLGYDHLAEKYLQQGIDLQAHLNSEGHLQEAEINLAVLKIKLGKYKQAQHILAQLITYKLSVKDRVRVQAWIAINQVKMHDHISSYATAKETFNNEDSPQRVKFISGIALVVSALELERFDEGENIFNQLTHLANDKWLIEYQMFLDMALEIKRSDTNELKIFQEKQSIFSQKVKKIKELAKPNYSTLKELDAYLGHVLSN
jgi:DNA-binding winged helix-turn-helix (wHTH) protein